MNEASETTPAPAVAQRKSIEELLSEAQAQEKLLYAEYLSKKAIAEPYEKAKDEVGDRWCSARRRIEMLIVMQKEIAQ